MVLQSNHFHLFQSGLQFSLIDVIHTFSPRERIWPSYKMPPAFAASMAWQAQAGTVILLIPVNPWAAQCNTWLLNQLTAKDVVFSFLDQSSMRVAFWAVDLCAGMRSILLNCAGKWSGSTVGTVHMQLSESNQTGLKRHSQLALQDLYRRA